MKIDRLISSLNIIKIVVCIFVLWLYIDSLVLNANYLTLVELRWFGNTTVVIPDFTAYQFYIIQTIPLFILVLLGTEKFIRI